MACIPLFRVNSLSNTIVWLKGAGVKIIGTTCNYGDSLKTVSSDLDNVAVIMGAEDKGMDGKIKNLCDILVQIPITGNVSSLNVSVATGVILYQISNLRIS
jgi:23S rRNA (guanosine2251-2'-O)-methyltransferase